MDLETRYPLLTEFMDKFLYQGAAPSLDECILIYSLNGLGPVVALVEEAKAALVAEHADCDLSAYVARHSDYSLDTGAATISHFIRILGKWLSAAK